MLSHPKYFGNYRLLEEVGAGGLGRVFRAIDQRSGRTVAIKILHDKFVSSRKFLGIFHRELLIISRLNSKHLVNYVDSGFEPPHCFIVTEFIEGWSCNKFLKIVKKVPPLVALSMVMEILQGVDYLHLHDMIHSDLSTPNVLIEKSGRVLITDFGLACQLEIEDYKNYMIGTPGYYSPEHITDAPIVPQTDLYCAGLILYELITGQKAVPALPDRKKVLSAMKHINFDLVVCNNRKMQSMIRKILKQAIHPVVNRRVQSAEEMMYQIYSVLKAYQIRYTRYAIKKFLMDQGLVSRKPIGREQNIYYGSV